MAALPDYGDFYVSGKMAARWVLGVSLVGAIALACLTPLNQNWATLG
jgi:hypothetical protein